MSERAYVKKNPWFSSYNNARSRCVYPYGGYFGKVKFLMTTKDFKKLWFRDGAYLMKKPSIDRIDIDGDYTLENCRFVEFSENIIRKKRGIISVPILQLSKDGLPLKVWNSLREIERTLKFDPHYISDCVHNRRKEYRGYYWRALHK